MVFLSRAEALNAGNAGDAVLKIIVLRKMASCAPESNGRQFCSVAMIASYALTTAIGQTYEIRPQKGVTFGSGTFRAMRCLTT